MTHQAASGKISRKNVDIIFNALRGALAVKCEELLFDDFGISGRAVATNILIIQPMDDIFEFTALGIGRIQDLYNRLKLIIDDETLTATYEEFREGKVGKLIFKTKKTRIEYKCKDPDLIKTRKNFKDPMVLSFGLNGDAIRFMTSGSVAMKNKSVSFRLVEEKMYIRLIDGDAGDILDHLITGDLELSDDCPDNLTFSYEMPKLAPLLNSHRETTMVNISKRGVMNLTSEGFNIYLVPDF